MQNVSNGKKTCIFWSVMGVFLLVIVSFCKWYLNFNFFINFPNVKIFAPPIMFLSLIIQGSLVLLFAFYVENRGRNFLLITALSTQIILLFLLAINWFQIAPIDFELLFLNSLQVENTNFLRVSQAAGALLFTQTLGLIFFYLAKKMQKKIFYNYSAVFGSLNFIMSLFILLSYVYETPFFYSSRIIPVALLASISFLLLSFCLILLNVYHSTMLRILYGKSLQATMLRNFLAIILVFFTLQGWVESYLLENNNINLQKHSIISGLIILGTLTTILCYAKIIGGKFDKAYKELQDIKNQLHESDERWKFALEGAGQGVWDWNIQTQKVFYSKKWKEMLGYSEDEIGVSNKEWEERIHPDDKDFVLAEMIKHAKGVTNTYQSEYRLKCKNGSYIWVLDRGKTINRENNNALRIVGTHTDITELKCVEDLIHRKNILNDMGKMAKIGGWLYNFETKDFFWTQELYYIHDVDLDFIPTLKSIKSLYPKNEYEIFFRLFINSINNNETFSYKIQLKTTSNVVKWLHIIGTPIWKNGKLKSITGAVQDITERKIIEETILNEKERLLTTLNSIADGVITTDKNGYIDNINEVAAELLGWKRYELMHKYLPSHFILKQEDSGVVFDNTFAKGFLTNKIFEFGQNLKLLTRQNEELYIEGLSSPICDKDNNLIGIVIVFRNITEKIKFEEFTRRADKLESLGVLAGGIAHDFNNLLAGVFGYVEMALESTPNNSLSLEYLKNALQVSSRARALTQQLLTFAKGGAPIKTTTNLKNILHDNTAFAASGSGTKCFFNIAENLWLCDIDINQIAQVVDNLVINAVQAMPQGGTLIVSAENADFAENNQLKINAGKYIKLSFNDTGAGIPKELQDRIFDPFFTTKKAGNGLGLATCFSIIKNHKGYIFVHSEVKKGTQFTIYLPVSHKQEANTLSKLCPVHFGKGKILVMDDDSDVLNLFKLMLSSMGYKVVCVTNGEEAIARYKNDFQQNIFYNFVILDLTIPGGGLNGRQTGVEIIQFNPNVILIAASGYSDDPLIANPQAYGFTGSIKKPFNKFELSEVLNKLVPAQNMLVDRETTQHLYI